VLEIKRPSFSEFRLISASLADQGVVSLGSFLTQVVLARTLAPREYGIFALLFGVLILLNVCHWALVTYPLSVQGASADERALRRLTTRSLALTVLLAVPLCSIAAGTTFFLKQPKLAPWVALALLLWQLQETLRRAFMAHVRHRDALWGDALSYLGQGVILWALAATGRVTLPMAFATIALTSGIAGSLQGIQLGLDMVRFREVVALIPSYWRIGNWALFAHFADTATLQALPWALGTLHGLEKVASFQAAANVLGISHPVMYGISNLVVPATVRAHQNGGAREGWRVTQKYAAWGVCALLPYYAVLLIWPRGVLSMFYGQTSIYMSLGMALRVLLLAYFFAYSFGMISAFFNGMKRPSLVFYSELFGVAAALGFGIPLAWYHGVMGACWGLLLVLLARTLGGSIFLRKLLQSEGEEGAAATAREQGAGGFSLNKEPLPVPSTSDAGSPAVSALPPQSD